MYSKKTDRQLTFEDFNQSCGMKLEMTNEWIILSSRIDWKSAEKIYSRLFPSRLGRPALPLRIALGALIIQKRMKLSDRALVKFIAENPYCQYFLGLEKFEPVCPFKPTVLVSFRKRLSLDFLVSINEDLLENAASTAEHHTVKTAGTGSGENLGTLILDATCSPSHIKYPQDFALLNEARVKTDAMIDIMHAQVREARHPRTYKKVLQAEYLALAKARKHPEKKVRTLIHKLLEALKRNLAFIDAYLARHCYLDERRMKQLSAVRMLYSQQLEMYKKKIHRVDDRIVSLSQPYLRPIVRGKTKTPVEFGAKYDVSIDEKGHARLEKIDFSPYNECGVLTDALERYKERTGHYPQRVLVDKIYRTRSNRAFCEERGIRMSGRKPGRPTGDKTLLKKERAVEAQDDRDRIEVERFFSVEKRCCGAGLIMTKLSETTLASIALSVLVANLFGTPAGNFFVFYFMDDEEALEKYHCMEFCE